MTLHQLSASLWNSPPVAIYSKWLKPISSVEQRFPRTKSGKPWSISLKDWGRCTIRKSCTETWNVPTFSLLEMEYINLAIWMFPKCLRKIWPEPKLELHTMLLLKSGKISHMASKVTCGLWAACFMRWLHWNLHLLQLICQAFTKRFAQGFSHPFLPVIQLICQKSLLHFWSKILVKGRIQLSFCRMRPSIKCTLVQLTSRPRNKMMMISC